LLKLQYVTGVVPDGAAAYDWDDCAVVVGKFTAGEGMDYTDPRTGKTVNANAFSISALHEIGHAVDAKYKIMGAAQQKPSCGAWESLTLNAVAAALLDELKTTAKPTVPEDVLKDLLTNALSTGSMENPGTIDVADWLPIEAQLKKAASMRVGKSPWETEIRIKNRAYHQSYPEKWVSYDPNARRSKVRDYQFRAAEEWFADLYAYSWFKKVEVAADKDVAPYLYSQS
jgi:hypothetical protein